jgi:SAM-dependent methyltransferase
MGVRRWLFHRIVATDPAPAGNDGRGGIERDEISMRRFFDRLGDRLDIEGKAVLDIGCGTGAVCVEAARRGASQVVGVDLQLIDVARGYLATQPPHVSSRVEFIETDGSLVEISGRQFDVILSKDSFEHYADPESFVRVMTTFLAPGGQLAMGFGPLWKAPSGGHIDYMTRLPWAHLIFPENVIMAERRRFRPAEDALRFEDIVGGLNKITYRRFEHIMAASGLTCSFLETNVSDHPVMRVMRALRRLPGLREYFTLNVYTIWQQPPALEDAG